MIANIAMILMLINIVFILYRIAMIVDNVQEEDDDE